MTHLCSKEKYQMLKTIYINDTSIAIINAALIWHICGMLNPVWPTIVSQYIVVRNIYKKICISNLK
jgi:hypothetical protein